MPAKQYDSIITTVDLRTSAKELLIPKGTSGIIVECYDQPTEGYAVDLSISDSRLVTEFSYENVILKPNEFEVVCRGKRE